MNKHVSSYVSYSNIFIKKSLGLCFFFAALNGLEVIVRDIGNANLNTKPRGKCYVAITDPYLFGSSTVGKKAQIVKALYGMKSSGTAWRE